MGVEPETRAEGRHSRKPAGTTWRVYWRNVYWHLTRAPRPRLFGLGQDPIRAGLLALILIMVAFGTAIHDLFFPSAWWAPFRGLACLMAGAILVWLVFAYLGRPVIKSQRPSVADRLRRRVHRNQQEGS